MATVFVYTNPPTNIDYSLVDGRVRSFELRGEILYDENQEISVPGWKDKLVEFVKEQGLDDNGGVDGINLHAFVYGLIDGGLVVPNMPVSGVKFIGCYNRGKNEG